jgi:hypothetical protein
VAAVLDAQKIYVTASTLRVTALEQEGAGQAGEQWPRRAANEEHRAWTRAMRACREDNS